MRSLLPRYPKLTTREREAQSRVTLVMKYSLQSSAVNLFWTIAVVSEKPPAINQHFQFFFSFTVSLVLLSISLVITSYQILHILFR